MTGSADPARQTGGSDASPGPGLHAAAFLVVLLTPALAWVIWVFAPGQTQSDGAHIGWFITVASGCVLAGWLARPRGRRFAALWAVAVVATLVTLYLWWSTADVTGLFVIGIALAVLPVVCAAPVLLGIGSRLGRTGRSPSAAVR
ncbi:MAG: hypothetical protein WA892_07655 [Ornithinimicrobium sp.]